ncbi:MAG TPA: hypothetical protein VL728_11535 [Cyclobacteriaceae bacterium]|jgi:hypothetical protein|nr:hypothetical protein [Cyclobacteriaceae bacterium]
MKEINEYEKDLASIRSIMERSVKFISLSGLSGVLSGIYALVGAWIAYQTIYSPLSPVGYDHVSILDHPASIFKLEVTGFLVLLSSLTTGFLMSLQKARKMQTSLWSSTSRQLMKDLAIPLVAGGIFILVLLVREYYVLLVPATLLFYGLALVQSSRNTFSEVMYLGLTEIILGLISAMLPGYGLILWAVGFGAMHILYGAIMYFRYER